LSVYCGCKMNWAVTVGYNILYLSDHPKYKVAVVV